MNADAAVIIPARDEERKVGEAVRSSLGIDGVSQVIVVDDSSSDGTPRVAEAAGARVIRLPSHLGKGGALTAGLALLGLVEKPSADMSGKEESSGTSAGETPSVASAGEAPPADVPGIVLFLDADLGETAGQAEALLKAVREGEADMTIAAFPPVANRVGFGRVKALAVQAIRSEREDLKLTSPLSGQRAMTAKCLRACLPLPAGFGVEVALTVRALRAGMKVVEVPLQMTHTATGNDLRGILHRARQYLDVRRTVAELNRER